MSTCVLSAITMHVRCNYEKRKEIIGHDPSVASVREVRKMILKDKISRHDPSVTSVRKLREGDP